MDQLQIKLSRIPHPESPERFRIVRAVRVDERDFERGHRGRNREKEGRKRGRSQRKEKDLESEKAKNRPTNGCKKKGEGKSCCGGEKNRVVGSSGVKKTANGKERRGGGKIVQQERKGKSSGGSNPECNHLHHKSVIGKVERAKAVLKQLHSTGGEKVDEGKEVQEKGLWKGG